MRRTKAIIFLFSVFQFGLMPKVNGQSQPSYTSAREVVHDDLGNSLSDAGGANGEGKDVSIQGKRIDEFVRSDGRIDLEALRKSGYQGPLDLKGVDVHVDPKTGGLSARLSNSAPSSADPDDIYWDNSISPAFPGVNGRVFALAVHENKLIAGGTFDSAGGVASSNIASWNDSSWSALGLGLNDAVYALTVYENQLVAGGSFTTAGGVSASKIASWDGTTWSNLGTSIDTLNWMGVSALTVLNELLIVGGRFDSAGGIFCSNIASWDGASWSALGSGTSGSVGALVVYNNLLIAGGSFNIAGGLATKKIASWNGLSWSALGSGLNGDVFDLEVYNNQLIAGGRLLLLETILPAT